MIPLTRVAVYALLICGIAGGLMYRSCKAEVLSAQLAPDLKTALQTAGLQMGDPVFIRAFKEERELELYVKNRATGKFDLFRKYPIVAASGDLGPKLAEGDGQVPEGFYAVSKRAMNPNSKYHLAFNIGYPNDYDRSLNRTGSAIMVHGSNVSIGCLAMTNEKIEEIYALCDKALDNGQPFFRVHIFPFRMTEARMAQAAGTKWRTSGKTSRKVTICLKTATCHRMSQ